MARGDRREEIFRDDRNRWKFLDYLAEGAERYRVKVYCYVLMENHFHLVVMTPEGRLPSGVVATRIQPGRRLLVYSDGRMAYIGSVADDTKKVLGRDPLLLRDWAKLHAKELLEIARS
jgi:REP element-mobilizing transposase RayT